MVVGPVHHDFMFGLVIEYVLERVFVLQFARGLSVGERIPC